MTENDPRGAHMKIRLGAHDLLVELSPEQSVRLDAEGRWCSYRNGTEFFRRSLDGDVVLRRASTAISVEKPRRDAIVDEVFSLLREAGARLLSEPGEARLHGEPGTVRDALERIDRALSRSSSDYESQTRLFHEAYPEPIGVLPPDRYRDVVVTPALGCPHGRCHFCTLFPIGGFRVLARDAFEDHLEKVERFFGHAIETRDGIFLGSASALSLPQARLLEVLHLVERSYGSRRRGVACFHDPDHAPKRTADDHRELRDAGLRHVTVGLETGLPELRETLGKSGDVDGVVRAVTAQRVGGLCSAVTILVGAGGPELVERHRRRSVNAIGAMRLGREDRVFLSPLEDSLSREAMARELETFRARLGEVTSAKVAPYRLELFRYYA